MRNKSYSIRKVPMIRRLAAILSLAALLVSNLPRASVRKVGKALRLNRLQSLPRISASCTFESPRVWSAAG